ncbi:F-box protein FBW2-like [Nicotiana tomentosiformis]|uniref:F-box protein FBW2-like n=1 Tax=Nicotiana tomentosiformis TaxID=4098 RepID=UPI00051B4860|nr:F-box protein FBW2-like [Nicotiana tomentosiformis]
MEGESSKRACVKVENDVVGGRWDELNPEILASIFVRIVPAEVMVRTVALVCRSWMEAVAGPYCWAEIDLENWCRKCCIANNFHLIDPLVRKIIRRSRFTFRRLSTYRLGNVGFSFAANCGRCLKILQIPMSEITDQVVEKHAGSLVNLTFLDISYCLNITEKGLKAFGLQCKSLTHLRRNMPPWELPTKFEASHVNDHKALIIAENMSGHQRLDLAFNRLSDNGLDAILTQCKALTHLEIQGCWNVELKGNLEERCEKLVDFRSPWIHEYEDGHAESSDIDSRGDEYDEESIYSESPSSSDLD